MTTFHVVTACIVAALLTAPTAHAWPATGARPPPEGSMTCDITKYGAKGDGKTDNTKAIQAAIDACGTAGGGTVLFPENGGDFLSGSLYLRSNIVFSISKGAELRGSQAYDAYPFMYSRFAGAMGFGHASLLNGANCTDYDGSSGGADKCKSWSKLHDVTIQGPGTINGQGQEWWDNCNPTCPDGSNDNQRPTLLGLLWIDGLTIQNIELKDSPFWTTHPTFCNNVVVQDAYIHAPPKSKNTDGIDPDSCTNVHVRNCTIDTGDDVIAIKSGIDWSGRQIGMPTANVLVEDCHFLHGHGVSIGSEMSGDVENITVRNCRLQYTERCVRVKTMRGRGGIVRNVTYENLEMTQVGAGISIDMFYGNAPPTNKTGTPIFRDIVVRNVTGTQTPAGLYKCLPESPCTGLVMEDVHFSDPTGSYKCENAYGTASNNNPKACFEKPSA